MEKYLVTVDDTEFSLSADDLSSLDIQTLTDATYHLLDNGKAYHVELTAANFSDRTLSVLINGNKYQIRIKDSYDQLVDQMGLLSGAFQKAKDIKAPMPGLIMNVLVEVGQEIEEGTPLLVLSAMKMENQILAQGAGTIKAIEVNVGDAVDKGQLIIEMES
ncbi:biotin/lipoyl-containing protein [Maribacter sp. R77961]|uniref:acetyl-CoA carboxylase biotin carboxyl carrier protein subunit n=1 Tax=Maribacter sp. R77961 TaxID=3093871 RepID=UPI0037CBEB35